MFEHTRDAKEIKAESLPKFFCKTCTKCTNKWCSFFNRYVEVTYNRCFYHSNYSPVATVYREPENLVELVLKEEEMKVA